MIIYEGSCAEFIQQSLASGGPVIGEAVMDCFNDVHLNCGESEFRSWNNSLPALAGVLEHSDLPLDSEIGIEYNIRGNKQRIDALICGKDESDTESAVVVELKQWSEAHRSDKPYYVSTMGARGVDYYWHPSYQAANYVGIIENFYAYVQDTPVNFSSCSYLHNMDSSNMTDMGDTELYPLVRNSPVFLKGDERKLSDFISRFIKNPCEGLLKRIDRSEIRPSPKLSDMLRDSLRGKEFFSYSDEQADSVSTIVGLARDSAKYGEKRTIIIRGEPGTGKSIVAINVLGQLVANEKPLNAAYFTPNSAPRELYFKKLIEDDYSKGAIRNLFKSPLSLREAPPNSMDCSLFDEAHRMYDWKGGTGLRKDVSLIEKCIKASRVSVFFIDEDQAVTVHDYATIDRIRRIADRCGSKLIDGPKLETQFRVLGGANYLNFVKSLLGYGDVEDYSGKCSDYDIRVFDKASEMRDELRKMNDLYGDSRMVAGYTYEWKTKDNYDNGYDIILDDGDFKAKWNMRKSDYSWLYDKGSFEDVGCIHTCQGLDLQYCGVIIGNDVRFEDGQMVFDQSKIALSDKSSGIRKCKDAGLAKVLIRNTYNVLLSRGMRGTFIYCEDEGLRQYVKECVERFRQS